MTKDGYPKSWDGSYWPPKTEKEQDFLKEQVDTEITAGHFSGSFGTKLLPGMYSPLVHAIPKPESEMLQLVIDHPSGDDSPNSMFVHEDVSGVQLNSLGVSILQIKEENPHADLILFKSDVSAAYQQLPMHPLYQILQIVMVNGWSAPNA